MIHVKERDVYLCIVIFTTQYDSRTASGGDMHGGFTTTEYRENMHHSPTRRKYREQILKGLPTDLIVELPPGAGDGDVPGEVLHRRHPPQRAQVQRQLEARRRRRKGPRELHTQCSARIPIENVRPLT